MFVSAHNAIYVDLYAFEVDRFPGNTDFHDGLGDENDDDGAGDSEEAFVYNAASGHVDPFPLALLQPLVRVEFEGGFVPAPNDPAALLDLRCVRERGLPFGERSSVHSSAEPGAKTQDSARRANRYGTNWRTSFERKEYEVCECFMRD
jgi:hypothetical protein